jgi:hypothetical protein
MKQLIALVAVLAFATTASAQTCRVGCPCGNTCISCGDTCRVGPGSARGREGETDTALVVVLVALGVAAAVALVAVILLTAPDMPSAEAPSSYSDDDDDDDARSRAPSARRTPSPTAMRVTDRISAGVDDAGGFVRLSGQTLGQCRDVSLVVDGVITRLPHTEHLDFRIPRALRLEEATFASLAVCGRSLDLNHLERQAIGSASRNNE